MQGLGIYRIYKRIKNEQELLNPVEPVAKQGNTLGNKFTTQDNQRYMELVKTLKRKESKLKNSKKDGE